MLIVGSSTIEAPALQRRLQRWGGCVTLADADAAVKMLRERSWNAVLVDHAGEARAAMAFAGPAGRTIPHRIGLITPGERAYLPALKQAGFTGYLVKPVRAASLKARLATVSDAFESLTTVAENHAANVEASVFSARHRKLSVLVAEDNDINALLTCSLLSKLGHRSTVAASGTAVLDAWRDAQTAGKPYDLVLMDVHMPGLDGLEAASCIRAMEAARDGLHTPIIALTANAFAEEREACLAAGMDGFLVKPIDRDRLVNALANLPDPAPIAA